ncbi:MAG: GGDEF domain-containing protein [Eubacteriales bacterium]|nr:GGDEF domain-containing protein [Eubacteriales bacterium]
MKAVKRKMFRLNVRTKVSIAMLVLGMILVGISAFMQFGGNVKGLVEEQARKSLQSVGIQNAKMLDEKINAEQMFLTTVAKEISRSRNRDVKKILGILGSHRDNYGYFDMGVVNGEGLCVTVNGESFHMGKDSDYLQRGMNGESLVSESYLAGEGELPINFIAVPVVMDGETTLILAAAYRSRDFLEMTDISSFDGNGRSVAMNGQGRCVALWEGGSFEELDGGMAAYLDSNGWMVPGEAEGDPKQLFYEFEKDGTSYLGFAAPMEKTEWYLLTYAEADYMYAAAREINRNILYIILGLYGVIAAITGLFVFVYHGFQKKIFQVVFRDRLTGGKNYQYYKHIFSDIPQEERENRYLVNFDIDKFKMINLIYGVKVGDDILKKVFHTFQETLPEDQIYHYHADIFVAIMRGKSKEEIAGKLECFCQVLEEKIENKELLELTVSFGICPLTQFDQINLIYSNALLAKNEIKGSFTEKFRFYDDNLEVQVEYRNMELAFREAIQKKEFQVWYQPKYDMRSRRICGAEALVRWKKRDGTIIFPGSFIPVFENTGQIVELDEYVLKTVCMDINRAKKEGIDMRPISVNLSKLHLVKPGIVGKIQAITKLYSITGRQISFEITESTSYSDKRIMDQMVWELHQMGFQVDMDDYGKGSSTLLSLCDTSFDTIKLDKSFIDAIGSEKMNIIINSTINMANHLNMQIIAEGVENEEQAGFLVKNNCYMAQGYHYSKPLEREGYLSLLKKEASMMGALAVSEG